MAEHITVNFLSFLIKNSFPEYLFFLKTISFFIVINKNYMALRLFMHI